MAIITHIIQERNHIRRKLIIRWRAENNPINYTSIVNHKMTIKTIIHTSISSSISKMTRENSHSITLRSVSKTTRSLVRTLLKI